MGYVIAVQIYTMYISKWFGAISNIQSLLIKPGLVVMTWNAQMTITIEFNISGTLLKIWKSENCSTYMLFLGKILNHYKYFFLSFITLNFLHFPIPYWYWNIWCFGNGNWKCQKKNIKNIHNMQLRTMLKTLVEYLISKGILNALFVISIMSSR